MLAPVVCIPSRVWNVRALCLESGVNAPCFLCFTGITACLRQVLGHTPEKPIEQKGSMVGPDRLRFDFSYGKGLTQEQLAEVERIVGTSINSALPVYHDVVPLARARAIHSLCAVFGETYPDPVRVISIGVPVDRLVADPENAEWAGYSVELCGGTHIGHTSQVCCCALCCACSRWYPLLSWHSCVGHQRWHALSI